MNRPPDSASADPHSVRVKEQGLLGSNAERHEAQSTGLRQGVAPAVMLTAEQAFESKSKCRNEYPRMLEMAAQSSITATAGGDKMGEKIVLLDLEDTATGRLLMDKCEHQVQEWLGMGGNSLVFKVRVVDQSAVAALGGDMFALKVGFAEFQTTNPNPEFIDKWYRQKCKFYERELWFVQELARRQGISVGGHLARVLTSRSHLAVPLVGVMLSFSCQLFVKDRFGSLPKVFLSKIMLTDIFPGVARELFRIVCCNKGVCVFGNDEGGGCSACRRDISCRHQTRGLFAYRIR